MKSVFISHSSKDKAIADVIVYSLEQEGISVWIAPRDIPGGTDYGASIMKGLRECEVLVLVFSKASNESDAVIREVQLAFNEKKAIIPFRIEDVPIGDSLAFYLSGLHWIDAVQKKKKDLNVLLKDVKGVLQKLGREIEEMPPRPKNAFSPTQKPTTLPLLTSKPERAPTPKSIPLPATKPARVPVSEPMPVSTSARVPKPEPMPTPVQESTRVTVRRTLVQEPTPSSVHSYASEYRQKKSIFTNRQIFATSVYLCIVIGAIAFFFAIMGNDPVPHASADEAISFSFASGADDDATVDNTPEFHYVFDEANEDDSIDDASELHYGYDEVDEDASYFPAVMQLPIDYIVIAGERFSTNESRISLRGRLTCEDIKPLRYMTNLRFLSISIKSLSA